MKEEITNVMRLLEQRKIPYTPYNYLNSGAISGLEVASALNKPTNRLFKTLVTRGKSNKYYVFVVPVDSELDLKKGASKVNEKNIEMIKSKELLPLTGYIHGGCSPIGMKKFFTTTIDESAKNFPTIFFSAGKIGYFVEVAVTDLPKIIDFTFADLKV